MIEISWHWPWVFFLLPLPWLMRFIPALPQSQSAALNVSYLARFRLAQAQGLGSPARSSLLATLFALAIWVLLLTALARPYQLGEVVEIPISGRDLLMVVDLSRSMEIEDMRINNRPVDRLVALKSVLNKFIQRRVGDRLGLVLFGSEAYLQAPLTFDRPTVQQLLNEAQIGLAGEQTAIGDALGLSIKRLLGQRDQNRVIVLVTDGTNNAGELDPLKAADLAKQNHIKIYTIGLGAESLKVSSFFGSRTINPSADMDEQTLQEIANRTGGMYFRARDSQELNNIYQVLDELEPTEKDPQIFRPQQNLYHWPLLAAFILSLILVLQQSLPLWWRRLDA